MNAKEVQPKEKRGLKLVFKTESGSLRIGWRILICAAAYFAAYYGVFWILGVLFGALFDAWGLTSANLAYAPAWAQWIVAAHTDFSYAATYTISAFTGILLANRLIPEESKKVRGDKFAAAGLVLAAVLTVFSLLFDSMRLEAPLSELTCSLSQISALIVLLLGVFSSEVVTRRLVFSAINSRFGRRAAFAASGLLTVVLTARLTNVSGILTALMMGLSCCVLYERGGLFASTALMAGWTAWTTWLFAWPDTVSASVYRLYTVSDAWLTGGDAGAACGWGSVFLWGIFTVVLLRKELKGLAASRKEKENTDGKDSHCNRRTGIKR